MIERFSPLVDFTFKRLYGTIEDQDILIDFLNSLLKMTTPIEKLEIQNPYLELRCPNL